MKTIPRRTSLLAVACLALALCVGRSIPASAADVPFTVRFLQSDNTTPIAGASVSVFKGGSEVTLGATDPNGQLASSLAAGSWQFTVYYGYAKLAKSQNISLNPIVDFRTTKVTVSLKKCDGSIVTGGGDVTYFASGSERLIGSAVSGSTSIELLPLSYQFTMNYTYGTKWAFNQNVGTNPNVDFRVTEVTFSYSCPITFWWGGDYRVFTQPTMLMLTGPSYQFKFGSDTANLTISGCTMNPTVNQPPTVNTPPSQTVNEGQPVALTASACGNGPFTFQWVNNDGTVDATDNPLPIPAALLDDGPSSFTLRVRAVGANDIASAWKTITVQVKNVAPTATVTASSPVQEGGPITFTFSSPFDPSTADTLAGFTYRYDLGSGYGPPTASSSITFTAPRTGIVTVKGKIIDKNGDATEYSTAVTVNNVAPVVSQITVSPDTIHVNSHITASATFTDPGPTDTHTAGWVWGDGQMALGTLTEAPTQTGVAGSVSHTHSYSAPGPYTITLGVTDKDGALTIVQRVVEVVNRPPILQPLASPTVDEGLPPLTLTASATDPDGDAITYYWDLENDGVFETGGNPVTLPASWFDDGLSTHTFAVRAVDAWDASDPVSATVTVKNVAPTAEFMVTAPEWEGGQFTLSFSNPKDPSQADTQAGFKYAYDKGDGNGYCLPTTANSTTFIATHSGNMTVRGKVIDKDGGEREYTSTASVGDAAPSVGPITVNPEVVQVNSSVAASATFADPGSADTHTANWDWGDSQTATGTVAESGGSGSVSDTHTYIAAGIYVVTLTVTDDGGASTTVEKKYVMVFDAGESHLKAEGWYTSPLGALKGDPSDNSKATFNFAAQYDKKGNLKGDGHFHLEKKVLDFHMKNFTSLVIDPNTGMSWSQGTGEFKGKDAPTANDCYFIIWAKDNSPFYNPPPKPKPEADTIHILIWDANSTYYDNSTDQLIGDGKIEVKSK